MKEPSLHFHSPQIILDEIFHLTKCQNQYHISANPFITPTLLSAHICLICLSLTIPPSSPYLAIRSPSVHTLWHISSVIFPFSPPYAKKGICIPESGWQGTLISSEGLWKGSDSAWKGDSKGKLGDISWQSSERGLTRQRLAANQPRLW